MVWIALAEQAAAPFGSFQQHAVAAGIRGAVGHAMLHDMHINAGAEFVAYALLSGPLEDFLHRKVSGCLPLAMQERSGHPDLVRHLDVHPGRHSSFSTLFSATKYYLLFQYPRQGRRGSAFTNLPDNATRQVKSSKLKVQRKEKSNAS